MVTLPKAAEFKINAQLIRPESLELIIRQIVEARPRCPIFVQYNVARRADYERVGRAIRASGGHAFDLQLSHLLIIPADAPVDIPPRAGDPDFGTRRPN